MSRQFPASERIGLALRAWHDHRGTFTLAAFVTYFNGNGPVGSFDRSTIGKALRAQRIVKVVKPGVYRLRGRATPSRYA